MSKYKINNEDLHKYFLMNNDFHSQFVDLYEDILVIDLIFSNQDCIPDDRLVSILDTISRRLYNISSNLFSQSETIQSFYSKMQGHDNLSLGGCCDDK